MIAIGHSPDSFLVDSEILRSQIVNFHFIPIIVRQLRENSDLRVQTEAAKLLGNLAFNHVVNQNAIMSAQGDTSLCRGLTSAPLQQCPELVRACAIGLANLAYTSVNQLSIGYGDAMTLLLQLLVDATQPSVLEAVAVAVSCLCHQNPLNKTRAIAQNGLQVLLFVLQRNLRTTPDEDVLIAVMDCFSILARAKAGRQHVFEGDAHVPLCYLCQTSSSQAIVHASARALCVSIPSSAERHALQADGKPSKLELNGLGLKALERARFMLYPSTTGSTEVEPVPSWLVTGMQLLQTGANACLVSDPSEVNEYYERVYFSMESFTDMTPDDLCASFYTA